MARRREERWLRFYRWTRKAEERMDDWLVERVSDRTFDRIGTAYERGFVWLRRGYCLVAGHHRVVNDHCGKPEHRLCEVCDQRRPNEPIFKGA